MFMFEDDDLFDDVEGNEPIVDTSEEGSIFDEPLSEETIFEEPKSDPTLLDEILKAKGITDSKIVIIDENNTEKEVDFYSLSKEEQLEILTGSQETVELQEDQQDFFNYLQDNNLTLQEYLEKYKEMVLAEVANTQDPSYDIDAYDDEELFLLDLKTKYDLTDEELTKELEKALEDKDLFNKKVSKLRVDYKQLEDAYKEEQQKEFTAQREQQYNQFVDQMVDVAVKTPELFGIELEDDEKNNVLSFLLELDDSGSSNFYKSLENPENLYKAAWFLTYGSQAFDAIKNAYETEINNLKKQITKVVVKK